MTTPKVNLSLTGKDPISRIEGLLNNTPDTLPILRQSCLQILDLTSTDTSSASDIGEVIMHDQALTAKIIGLANSPAYRTRTKIATPTQAVTIVGFEVVRSITVAADLLERAEEQGESAGDLKQLLAKALVAATQAHELGTRIKYPEPGILFTSAMLYSLGDLVLAYHLPDIYQRLEHTRRTCPDDIPSLEMELLGRSLHSLSASLAKQWHLPDSLIQLMETKLTLTDQALLKPTEQLRGLVYCSNKLGHYLLDPQSPSQVTLLNNLLTKMSSAFQLPKTTIETLITQAFQKASHICQTVNIETEYYIPQSAPPLSDPHFSPHPLITTLLKTLDENQTFSLQLTSHHRHETETIDNKQVPHTAGLPLWDFLQTFALKALHVSNPNSLLQMAMDGLYHEGQFERGVLTLLTSSGNRLEARLGYGKNIQDLLPLFNCSLHDKHLLVTTLQGYEPIKLNSLMEMVAAQQLSMEFVKKWGAGACLFGPLFAKNRGIGIIVADRGISEKELSEEDYALFLMVISQINANLTRMATKPSS